MCHRSLGLRWRPQPQIYCRVTDFLPCAAVNTLFCCNHLAVEEAEANFGAVNHAPIVLNVDAALLPAAGRVVGWIPFYVLYCLQIFMGHFLPQNHNVIHVNAALINQTSEVGGVDREPRSYLPGGDGAEDVDDAVRLLLPLLGILLAKQTTAAGKRAQASVTPRYLYRASGCISKPSEIV